MLYVINDAIEDDAQKFNDYWVGKCPMGVDTFSNMEEVGDKGREEKLFLLFDRCGIWSKFCQSLAARIKENMSSLIRFYKAELRLDREIGDIPFLFQR